jgi:hypothetical protein
MSVQSKTKQSEKRRNNRLKPDVVMTLFLHETLGIRNLTKHIQELDGKLAQEFAAFSRISESIEKENNQILDLLLEPIFGRNGLRKPDCNSSVISRVRLEQKNRLPDCSKPGQTRYRT